MRKTFKLQVEGKHPDRVLDAIKHEVRKYVKRQRRVPLPAGVDFWDFDCKFGSAEESAEPVHLAEIITRMDAAAAESAAQPRSTACSMNRSLAVPKSFRSG